MYEFVGSYQCLQNAQYLLIEIFALVFDMIYTPLKLSGKKSFDFIFYFIAYGFYIVHDFLS